MDTLLTRAQHAVIIGAAPGNLFCCLLQVHIGIHQGLHVAGAYAEGGLAAGVGRLDHAGAAGGDAGVAKLHDEAGGLHGGFGHHLNQVLGIANFPQRLPHELHRLDAGLLGTGMGANDDGVTAL